MIQQQQQQSQWVLTSVQFNLVSLLLVVQSMMSLQGCCCLGFLNLSLVLFLKIRLLLLLIGLQGLRQNKTQYIYRPCPNRRKTLKRNYFDTSWRGSQNILSKIEALYFVWFITQSGPTNSQPLVENVQFYCMKASCMPIKSAKIILVLHLKGLCVFLSVPLTLRKY